MAYNEKTAERVRKLLDGQHGVKERKMFGGLAFMVNGHMSVGVIENNLVLRLGDDSAQAALREPHAAPMDFTGKPMKSMVYVRPEGHKTDAQLRGWLGKATGFARSLPKK